MQQYNIIVIYKTTLQSLVRYLHVRTVFVGYSGPVFLKEI